MRLIKEPINIDFSSESKPWSEEELFDFRKLMEALKLKNAKPKPIQKVSLGVRTASRKKVIA